MSEAAPSAYQPTNATAQADSAYARLRRTAFALVAVLLAAVAGALVGAAALVPAGLALVGLSSALIVACSVLLVIQVGRIVDFARQRARYHARLSSVMLQAVERFSADATSFDGSVCALLDAADAAGCDVLLWRQAQRSLVAPATGERFVLTPAAARRLLAAVASHKPLSVPDVSVLSTLPVELTQRSDARAVVLAPMWAAGEFLGIVLRSYPSAAAMLAANESGVVSGLAALGAVALGRAEVLEREQQRAQDNELLMRSVELASDSERRDTLADYASEAAEAVGAGRCAIYVVRGGQLKLVGSHGIAPTAAMGARTISLRAGLGQLVELAKGSPAVIAPHKLDADSAGALEHLGFTSECVLQPVTDAQGSLAGLLVLEARGRELGGREVSLLAALARQVAMTFERRRMWRAIRKRSRHLACTPKLARSLTGQRDPEAVARIAARELHEGFGFCRVSIALADEPIATDAAEAVADDTHARTPGAGAGHALRLVASAGMLAQRADGASTTTALETSFREARPYIYCVADASSRLQDGNAPTGCKSQIVVPIINNRYECCGVIAVYERDSEALSEDDLHMLETVADQLAGTIEQADLFQTLERSYFKTVEALSAALEAKDAYTLDHARSITDMAASVGRRMGMLEEEIRDLKFGALLHDIGKIGVPGHILNKPGPLDPDEYRVMQQHTIIGEQIIAPIEFLSGVRPLVLHEHERWDGAGYPHGLRGKDIPLGARIIFVCDAFHAMTSDRPYRKALDVGEAKRRLVSSAGRQFDPEVVDAFLETLALEEEHALVGAGNAAGTTSTAGGELTPA